MITQRAWLVGVVGFCFYLITIVNDLPSFYYALTWLAAGVLGSSLGIAFLSLIGLRCAWRTPREVVMENFSVDASGPVVEVQLANAGTLNKTGVLVEVRLQRIDDDQLFSRRFLMEALPSGDSITTALPLRHLRRGRYKVLELHLVGSDVLGLFSVRKRVPPGVDFQGVLSPGRSAPARASQQRDEVVVGPAALARGSATLSPSQLARREGGTPMTRSLGSGEDIRGTRLYVPGDDLRYVHWKSTARKGQLVVKEFHHTVQEQTLVIWDGAAPPRAPEARKTKVEPEERDTEVGFNACEWSLRLTASLCRALMENHRPCALLRLDDTPLALGASQDTHGNDLTMAQIGESLADARCNRTTNISEAFVPFQAHWMGGEIYLVTTTAVDAAALGAKLRILGARVVVGLVDMEAFAPTTPPEKKRRRAKAQEAPAYVEIARILRQAGARVVVVSPLANSRDFSAPILTTVQEILEPTGERQQSETESQKTEKQQATSQQTISQQAAVRV